MNKDKLIILVTGLNHFLFCFTEMLETLCPIMSSVYHLKKLKLIHKTNQPYYIYIYIYIYIMNCDCNNGQ